MVIVVGGSRRKCGKTTVVESLVRENAEAAWTAIKIAAHRHEPTAAGDTARYLAAGARRAELVVAPDLAPCLPQIQRLIAASTHTIIESTRILEYLKPDVAVMVVDEQGEIKESCRRHSGAADVVMFIRRITAAPL